mmetsp:Transcript_12583/g.36189  ORF Transcript_12583/g.36189 Transcript_12583/m.36189 type:complete len:852 (+) Transcript_12583:52-2607(+)
MEIGFWRCLFSEDDSRLLLRQRAPEVVIFRGCRLESWYHSNASGLFVRRMRNVSIQSALECFLTVAQGRRPVDAGNGEDSTTDEGIDPQTPVAILRRCGAAAIGLDISLGLADVPMAVVLTAQELSEVFQRAQNGIEDEAADVWSVQTIVRPADGVRVLSVYNCDATGLERSDIFGRSYDALYNTMRPRDAVLPTPEAALAVDQCIPLTDSHRASVEAKTLGIVRFASRFHNLELEGLVLEFILDSRGCAVLHGCWCASVFSPEVRRRFRSGGAASRRASPRVFPVPAPSGCTTPPSRPASATPPLRPASATPPSRPASARSASRRDTTGQGEGPPAEPVAAAPAAVVQPTPSFGSLPAGGAARTGEGGTMTKAAADIVVLLEVWRGNEFLGETTVNCAINAQRLQLRPADHSGPTRADARKRGPSAEALAQASVLVATTWRHSGDGRAPLMCFQLRQADGLPPPTADASPGVRAVLWLQQRAPTSQYSPLWASAVAEDAAGGTAVCWEESVELHVEDGPGRATPEVFSMGVPLVAWNFGPDADPELNVDGWDIRGRPVELRRVLRSARDLICGAQWAAHWGTCEADGTMRGSTLAAQVCQRWGTEKMNRSHLLTQLSYHTDQFSDLQQAWEAELEHARERVMTTNGDMDTESRERARIRDETASIVQEQEKRLAETCRQMCSVLDDHRIQEHIDSVALEQSRQRIAEQRTIVHQLIDKSQVLQGSLDRTVSQFDQVSSSYAQVQGEIFRAQVVRPRTAQDLDDSIGQSQLLRAEVADEEQRLAGLKSKLRFLQDELTREREISVRFEDFVRKIASTPAARLRTGGGFRLHRTAKSEAIAMLETLAALPDP